MVERLKNPKMEIAMENENKFFAALMEHVLDGRRIPKVQVERVVGPLLGFFIDRVLTETLARDENLSGKYITISPEFPFKKFEDNQSTNVDWLMYNKDRRMLVMLELKTTDSEVCKEQADAYLKIRDEINEEGAKRLFDDFDKILGVSNKGGKYGDVKGKIGGLFPGAWKELADCRVARVIYLVPLVVQASKPKQLKEVDKVLSFDDLSEEIKGEYSEEWGVMREKLQALDTGVPGKNEEQSACSGKKNYQGLIRYEEIKRRCDQEGAKIRVGFDGGLKALKDSSLEALKRRPGYKWDFSENGIGQKLDRNWIPGDRFLEVVRATEVGRGAMLTNRTIVLTDKQLERYNEWAKGIGEELLKEECHEGFEIELCFKFSQLGRSVEAKVVGGTEALVLEDVLSDEECAND